MIIDREYDYKDLARMRKEASQFWINEGTFGWPVYTMGIPGKYRLTIDFIEDPERSALKETNV